jgi:hypothetical protein
MGGFIGLPEFVIFLKLINYEPVGEKKAPCDQNNADIQHKNATGVPALQ